MRRNLLVIDAFNRMPREVNFLPQFGHVTFVDLRGTLSQGTGYKDEWANDLHPTKAGFRGATRILHRCVAGVVDLLFDSVTGMGRSAP